jgi:hypothetical protein
MAVSIPIVSEFINTGIKQAERAFMDIRKQVAQAEGTMGKFKAAGKGVFDAVSANAASFAAAGVSAFATFAAKGVSAFQDLALSADKFASATGLAVEEASRLIEVTGDLGIESATVQTAIGKMNQNLGKSPELFKELGVQVAYAKDGTVDANETFLNTIDRLNKIKDPATRAKVATQLLGKGWRDMSELIQMGSDELRKSLATVSDAKTISPEEVAKAKKFRDTMDRLGDTVGDLALKLGEVLVPVLEKAVEILNSKQLRDFFSGVEAGIKTLWSPIKFVNDQTKKFGQELRSIWDNVWALNFGKSSKAIEVYAADLRKAREDQKDFIDSLRAEKVAELTDGITKLRDALLQADTAWQTLTNRLDQKVALNNAEEALKNLEIAAAKAFATGADSDIAQFDAAAAEVANLIANIAGNLGFISSKEIYLRFRTEGAASALSLAKWLASGAELSGLSPNQLIGMAGFSFSIPGMAAGGPVSAGGTYVVGERGPELLTMGARSGYITPNGALGGNTVNVTVTSADPNQVVAALQQYVRVNNRLPANAIG